MARLSTAQVDTDLRRSQSAPDDRTFYQRRGKRLFDLAIGIPLFVLAVPVILLLATLVVVLSGRPAFYRAERVGLRGKGFRMWKLRTMVRGADQILTQWKEAGHEIGRLHQNGLKPERDPRETQIGRVLRRLSLDELPQLINVLRGDMSLVGPRPYHRDDFIGAQDEMAVITQVRPGLTGRWQTRGRNALSLPQRMAIDVEWIESVCLVDDLKCLALTILPVVSMNGH